MTITTEDLIATIRSQHQSDSLPPQSFRFDAFDNEELRCLLEVAEIKDFTTGEPVIKLSDDSTDLYILVQGQVEIIVPITQERTKTLTLGPGGVVGEVAFLDGESRSADVLAASPCSVIRISRESAHKFGTIYPNASVRLYQQLSTILALRLRRLDLFDATEIARDEERKALALELHDETMAELTALTMELAILGLGGDLDQELQVALKDARDRLKQTNIRLREIVKGVYPAELISLGLVKAFTSYLDNLTLHRISNPTPISISLEVAGFGATRLPEEIEADLFRLLQQSITNVIQHALASTVRIGLDWQTYELGFEVTDDGVGFDVSNPKNDLRNGHFGLANIRNRIERHGGTVTINSAQREGTTVSGRIPIVGRADEPSESRNLSFTLKTDNA